MAQITKDELNLHSTLFILVLAGVTKDNKKLGNLHSTLFILVLGRCETAGYASASTFHSVYISTRSSLYARKVLV